MDPVVMTAREHLKLTRDAYRETVRGMGKEALNWRPGPDTNPAAVLIVHIAGSERELLHTIRGLTVERDRDAEFRATAETDAELLAKLDAMDALFEEMAPHITADDLASPRTRWNGTTNTGLYWLLHDVSHLREHLGHIQLTKQLYERQKET
ncbi:MAG: DinB family protein [Chloroflexota bacterium]|nr:DinB family protein [Chloroflexota bacterium]